MSKIDGLNLRTRYRCLAQECLEMARTLFNVISRTRVTQ